MAKDRFMKIYSQGTLNITEIWVDRETGVNYIFHASGNARGPDASAGPGGEARGDICI